MGIQTIVAYIILVLVIPLLVYRIYLVRKDEQRYDKAGIFTILIILFSLLVTGFKPTLLDIIAIYLFWTAANMIAMWTGSNKDLQKFGSPPPSSKKIKRSMNVRPSSTQPIHHQTTPKQSPIMSRTQVKSVEISNSGEFAIVEQTRNVVRSEDFSIKVSDVTMFDVIRRSMTPDLDEFLLLLVALLLNWIIITPLTHLSLFNPFMIIYWGGLAFFLYTIRYSYTGPWQFRSRIKKIEKKLMEGIVVVDFKLIGFVWSFALIVIGSVLAV
jgi:hypothetical protein